MYRSRACDGLRSPAATLEALEAAVLFLKNDADIPHQSLLPYKLPILTLSRFFHLHPSPQPMSASVERVETVAP